MILSPSKLLRAPEGDGGAGGGAGAGTGGAGAGAGGAGSGAGGAGAGAGAGGGAGAGAGGGAGAGTAAPPPFFEGLYDKEGKIDKKSLDRLPEHLKQYKDVFSKYETVDALLHGFGNSHAMAVKKALTPLVGTEPAEVIAERKAHLDQINGVPKDVKGYGIARPETLPEEFWNQEGADKFALLAQKHSISPAAVKEILGLQVEITQGEIARGQAADTEFYASQDKAFAAGIQKQGMDADKAMDLATRGANTLGIDPKSPIFKNAAVRLALIRATQLVSEEKMITGGDAGSGSAMNERDQARDIMSNPQNPLHKAWADPNDPRHEQAKDRVSALYAAYKGPRST